MKQPFISSLRARLILLVLLAVIPSFALIIYIGLEQRQAAKAAAQGDALDLIQDIADEQAQRIESGRQLLLALAQLRVVRQPDNPACGMLFADLIKQFPSIYDNFSVAKINGDLTCSANPTTDLVNISDREYFQSVIQSRAFQASGYLISRATGKAVIVLSTPVLDDAGDLNGVVVGSIDLSWLKEALEKSQLPTGSTLTVIDRLGNTLSRYPEPEKYVGKSALDAPIVHAILERKTPGTVESRGVDGVERLFAFRPLYISNQSDPDAYIYSGSMPSAVYADADRNLTRNMLALGIVAILALAAAWFGSDTMFLRQTNVILEATQRLAKGDLTARAGISPGASELDQLAHNFDQMADSLEQREKQLRASEERYRTLSEASQDMIFVINRNDTVQYVNTRLARVFEREAQELIGKPRAELFSQDNVEIQAAELQRVFSTGELVVSESRVSLPSGDLWMSTSLVQLCDGAGNVNAILGVSRDLTERKRMEDVLRQSEQRLSLHVKQTPLAVIEWDCNFHVTKWNLAAERMFGYTESEALGRHAADLIVPSDARAHVDRVWLDLIEQKGGERSTNENFTKEGRTILCEWYNTPLITSDGQTIGVASLVQDITEQRRAEQELAKRADDLARSNAELEQFAFVASHDLQEPLRKIQAFGDRLKARYIGALDEQGCDYLERMTNAAGRMSTMINDLLAFSRVTTKGQSFATVDLASVARAVVSDLETRIEQTGGRVEIGDLPTIDADPSQMYSLLQNLIANGLKFRREGVSPLIKVSTSRAAERVEIRIEDNGIGFDEKYLDRIFQPFQRLHGRSEYEGTGIGLAICRKIAERHGGNITARTQPGQGAAFIVTLPLNKPKQGGQ